MKTYILLVGALMLFPHAGWTTILRVPQDYSTIQSAMNAAHSADTVLVSEGTYHENIKYHGKNILVASRFFITQDWQTVMNTVIDGSSSANKDTGSTVQFLDREDSTAILDGFTITGGTGSVYQFTFGKYQEGAGVILHYSSAVIRNNIIRQNTVQAASGVQRGGGGGIASMYGNPTIYNNIIVSNDAGYAGGIVLNYSAGKIFNNIIYRNTGGASYGTGGIMIWEPTTSTRIENNTIVGNYSYKDAGGINNNSSSSIVRNNIIWGNRQAIGGQVANPQNLFFNDIEDDASGSNISAYPKFQDGNFQLMPGSPCIDAGDTGTAYNDAADPILAGHVLAPSQGILRNDIGAYGGPSAKVLAALNMAEFSIPSGPMNFQSAPEKECIPAIPFFNLSPIALQIDSIAALQQPFSLMADYKGWKINVLSTDTIRIRFCSNARRLFSDTLKIYHHLTTKANPLVIALNGKSDSKPVVNKILPAQTGYTGQLFVYQLPDSLFTDADPGDTLTYTVSGLPDWLTFDPVARTFRGTPVNTTRNPLAIVLTATDILQSSESTVLRLSVQVPTRVDNTKNLPAESELFQNYPNPFNPMTVISYRLAKTSTVSLKVYTMLGEEVATLVDETRPAGFHTVQFDGSKYSSGVYFSKMHAGTFTALRKLVLLK